MESARVMIEVVAGVIPQRPEPELGRLFAITSAEWEEATMDGTQGILLSTRNGQAAGYAQWLMMQPDRVNWVRTDWLWL
jgi:hypothetical protein